jgi:two-component system nitrogen regulation response regulator NtrX
VIAATNKDLSSAVSAGTFRDDLYFRLNVVPLHCPALRERLDDIPLLVAKFVEEFCAENGFRTKEIEPGIMLKLRRYHWPGNVRELKNVTERMVIMSGERITPEYVPDYIDSGEAAVDAKQFNGMSLKELRDEIERDYVQAKLREYSWNITRTAEALGIERTNLHKKIKQLGIKKA